MAEYGAVAPYERAIHLVTDELAFRTGAFNLVADELGVDALAIAVELVQLLLSPTRRVGRAHVVASAEWPRDPLTSWSVTPIDVDQTNTSVIVAGPNPQVVVKVPHAWGSCDRSVRLLTQLSTVDSRDVPRFLGHVDWQHEMRGTGTVALATEFLPDTADGWTWAVDDVLAHLADGPQPRWPSQVGALTGRIHTVLAVASAAQQPPPPDWRAVGNRAVDDALAATGEQTRAALLARESMLRRAIDAIAIDAGTPQFDGHGDLHIGQFLRRDSEPNRLWLVDFDGDPQLPPELRESRSPAARDLAHLLVSVDLVAAVVHRRIGSASAGDRLTDWSLLARAQLLTAYRASAPTFDDRAIAGFEAEQIARELTYAARYLPRWSYAGEWVLSRRYPIAERSP